ncbi:MULTISPECIES: four-carbon acid sugar kinase family protein [unclassified Cyanobium]|uniref:four-carbon acid sugar kinase family protein n=1 Tax=unclassified Cyanobium TaxID=2627006 RepID=UPI0020CFAE06|nr:MULTISPECIES: four-carbon acid sugar kinase family protein [unclassified Cyanobium]MCP9834038.1 four-carbon acid sugar kinase family protein [Cyanobium sp. La Preciosa 7G6]MCP9936801.1 four-carbon acid sugar kinase family protein [Cyanobium sp. Aljojuca 7A6]
MAQATIDTGPDLKIVVIDDDPTGSQTVHGCPLLLRWDAETLAAGLAHPSPLLFVLANTRALAPAAAAKRVREICRAMRPALGQAMVAGRIGGWLVVSRGDSTLRGHFPLEVEVINEELGPFDATLLVPAFLEGGRTTVDGVHRLHGRPVHESPFARDGLFAYATSHLPDWVEEKSAGRLPATAVDGIGWRELEQGGSPLLRHLARLQGNVCVAVDGASVQQLAALAAAVRTLMVTGGTPLEARPRRFLFQSAASLIQALAGLPPQPLTPEGLAGLRRRRGDDPLPGLVLVGSHVPLADRQLERLLAEPTCVGVELDVAKVQRLLEGPEPALLLASLEQAWRRRLADVLAGGHTPVLFTSRGEARCRHAEERRALGLALAELMARLAAALAPGLGYLISKGGITTHALLADGLELDLVELQGQLLPGLSLVLAAPETHEGPLPVLTFPGNLGDDGTLREAWRWMDTQVGPP